MNPSHSHLNGRTVHTRWKDVTNLLMGLAGVIFAVARKPPLLRTSSLSIGRGRALASPDRGHRHTATSCSLQLHHCSITSLTLQHTPKFYELCRSNYISSANNIQWGERERERERESEDRRNLPRRTYAFDASHFSRGLCTDATSDKGVDSNPYFPHVRFLMDLGLSVARLTEGWTVKSRGVTAYR